MIPETRYARNGDVHIAYQVSGDGPIDVIMVPGFVSNVELAWEMPFSGPTLRHIGSFARVISFDKRGTGLSDRSVGVPTLEQRMDDVRAVMDAVGVEGAALFGISEGGPMCILFAATYPTRTSALVLQGSFARLFQAPDQEFGYPPEAAPSIIRRVRGAVGHGRCLCQLLSQRGSRPRAARAAGPLRAQWRQPKCNGGYRRNGCGD